MKQRYFRLPWSRNKYSQRKLYRLLLIELTDVEECLTDRRLKRLQTKHQIKEVIKSVYT